MGRPAPESRTVEVTNGRFHVRSWGRADAAGAVLLLHGFNQTCHSWDEVAPELSAAHRVVAFDQRGHGQSDRAADGDYSRQIMVDDATEIADALGLERFAVVGMSMGAVHALMLAAEAAHRVWAVVAVDYAPEIEKTGAEKILLMLARSWQSLDEAVREVRLFNPRRSEDNVRERLRQSLFCGPDGRWTWRVDPVYALAPRFREEPETMWQVVRRVACPALVVRGADSDVLSAAMAQRMQRELCRGSLATIAGAGHSVPGDNPRAFAEAVAPFLRDQGRRLTPSGPISTGGP